MRSTTTPSAPSLRQLRHQRGLTLEAVAVLAGVDPATTSRIERGLVEARPETIVRLARALGVSARRMAEVVARPASSALDGNSDRAS